MRVLMIKIYKDKKFINNPMKSFDSFCKMRLLSFFVSEHFMVEIACFALITSYFGKIAKLQS